ncbi:MAG: MobP3 family relaxase [Oscillospiraceae bacterium]|nr:MobP3 family relaxase [Oscillospiraceae bacterium]
MAKLILKSPYIKCDGSGKVSGYLQYIATRENVQRVPDGRLATQKQEQLIEKIVRDFPDSKDLFEYEDYEVARTGAAASAFITAALELNWDAAGRSDVYMSYIATRPGAQRLGDHGLFGDGDTVDLTKAMGELEGYTGNVWTHIISLRREDAARLGYDNARVWRNLLKAHRNEIAEAMKIPPEHFRWYAAFHDEGGHPHVHMMAWSTDPSQGYLTRDGIRLIRSKLTNDIFHQEMLHVYEQKFASRDELVRQARQAMLELTREMGRGLCDHPEAEKLLLELDRRLETVKGKKQYGYLPKPLKALADEIVDQMERLPAVTKCYDKWLELQGQVQSYYTGEAVRRLPLSKQKEFRAIQNAVIQEAERICLGTITFEDESAERLDEPENIYRTVEYYRRMRDAIHDESLSLDERDYAVEQMRQLAERGYPYAQHQMGKLYRDGTVVIPDMVEAKEWFLKAAAQEVAVSQYALGKLLLSEDAEVRAPAEGMRWLEAAVRNGSHYAVYRLGKEYLRGEVTEKDVFKALEYLNRSAEVGNQFAQYTLGKLYLIGREVPQDKELAEHWLTLSAVQGNEYARFFLDRMDQFREPSAMLGIIRLLRHMANIFRDHSLPKIAPVGGQIDRKLRRKLMQKKIAQGHNPNDRKEQNWTMSM